MVVFRKLPEMNLLIINKISKGIGLVVLRCAEPIILTLILLTSHHYANDIQIFFLFLKMPAIRKAINRIKCAIENIELRNTQANPCPPLPLKKKAT